MFKQSVDEGSLVIDVTGSNRMDVKFLCDQFDLFTYSHIWDSLTVIKAPKVTSVNGDRIVLPNDFSITNYPNPFNPSTKISYHLPQSGSVKIVIYDLVGRIVTTMLDAAEEKGYHTIDWNAKDENGYDLPSGIYFALIQSGRFTTNAKMILLR